MTFIKNSSSLISSFVAKPALAFRAIWLIFVPMRLISAYKSCSSLGGRWRIVTLEMSCRSTALTGRPEMVQSCRSLSRSTSVSRTDTMCSLFVRSRSFPRSLPQNFPPAGGIGDWGKPQQARLSYKRYACASAATAALAFAPLRGALFASGMVIAILGGRCPLPRKKEIISQESDAGKGTFRLHVPSEYHPMRERSFQG